MYCYLSNSCPFSTSPCWITDIYGLFPEGNIPSLIDYLGIVVEVFVFSYVASYLFSVCVSLSLSFSFLVEHQVHLRENNNYCDVSAIIFSLLYYHLLCTCYVP